MFNINFSSSPPFCCPSDNLSSCESSKNIYCLVHSANVSYYSTIESSRECIIKNTKGLKFLHVNARSLYPSKVVPIRITLHSSTLIDHIYVSNHLKPLPYGTCHTAFSDHLPVFIVHVLITSIKKIPYNR